MKRPLRSIRTVWLDVSLLMKFCDPRRPTGIPRTTAQIFRSLWARGYTNLRLCQPAPGPGGMIEVPPDEVLARFPIGPGPGPAVAFVEDGSDPLPRPGLARRLARRLPGVARRALRRAYRYARGTAGASSGGPAVPSIEFGPADLLLHFGAALGGPGTGAERFDQLHHGDGLRVVHLIYDLLPVLQPQFFTEALPPLFHDYFRLTLRQSELLLAISRQTRDDLGVYARQHGLPLPPVEVIRLGETVPGEGGGELPPAVLGGFRPFVLCVGTQEVRKNHHLLYHVWRRLVGRLGGQTPSLVIVGAPGWLTGDIMHQMRTDPSVREYVVLVPDCEDGQLRWLYHNCLFTVYPSHYEGWGLPIAESLGFGKACIASNTSSMPEIASDLTLLADPCDAPAWLDLIGRLLEPDFRAAQEARIRRLFRRTSWDDTTDQLVGHLERHFGRVFQSPPQVPQARVGLVG